VHLCVCPCSLAMLADGTAMRGVKGPFEHIMVTPSIVPELIMPGKRLGTFQV
jgi:hypothetical protein